MVEKANQVCQQCGCPFYGLIRPYCTKDCQKAADKRRAAQGRACVMCGGPFSGPDYKIYCGDACRSRSKSGSPPQPLAIQEPEYIPRRSRRYESGAITSRGHLTRSPLSRDPVQEPQPCLTPTNPDPQPLGLTCESSLASSSPNDAKPSSEDMSQTPSSQ